MKKGHEDIVKIKLNDTTMRKNLMNAMHTLQTNRMKVIDDRFSDWQSLRNRAKEAKNLSLIHI